MVMAAGIAGIEHYGTAQVIGGSRSFSCLQRNQPQYLKGCGIARLNGNDFVADRLRLRVSSLLVKLQRGLKSLNNGHATDSVAPIGRPESFARSRWSVGSREAGTGDWFSGTHVPHCRSST